MTGGSGDDYFIMRDTFDKDDTLDAGDGNDGLSVTKGFGVSTMNAANFEYLHIGTSSAGDVAPAARDTAAAGVYDLSKLDGSDIQKVIIGATDGGDITIDKLASGRTVTVSGYNHDGAGFTVGDVIVKVTDATQPGNRSDVLNLEFGQTGDAHNNGNLIVGDVVADGVETINVNSFGAARDGNEVDSIQSDVLEKLVITGNQDLQINFMVDSATLTEIDASAFSGNLEAGFGDGAGSGSGANAISGVVINSGSGDDAIWGGSLVDRVNLGAGDDFYRSWNTAAEGGDIITLGAGRDIVHYFFVDEGGGNGNADLDLGHRVTDFATGNTGDILQFDTTWDFGALTGDVIFDTGNGVAAGAAGSGDIIVLTGQSFGSYTDAEAFVDFVSGGGLLDVIIVYRDASQGAVKVVYDADTADGAAGEWTLATLENITTVGQLAGFTAANFELI